MVLYVEIRISAEQVGDVLVSTYVSTRCYNPEYDHRQWKTCYAYAVFIFERADLDVNWHKTEAKVTFLITTDNYGAFGQF